MELKGLSKKGDEYGWCCLIRHCISNLCSPQFCVSILRFTYLVCASTGPRFYSHVLMVQWGLGFHFLGFKFLGFEFFHFEVVVSLVLSLFVSRSWVS